jgi:hypothetical protein
LIADVEIHYSPHQNPTLPKDFVISGGVFDRKTSLAKMSEVKLLVTRSSEALKASSNSGIITVEGNFDTCLSFPEDGSECYVILALMMPDYTPVNLRGDFTIKMMTRDI